MKAPFLLKVSTVSLLSTFILGGCALSPASRLQVDESPEAVSWFSTDDGVWFPGLRNEDEGADETVPDIETLIDVVSITPDLVGEMEAEAASSRSAQQPSPELAAEIASYDYYIGKGDVLTITVYDHPELTIPAGSERSAVDAGNIVQSNGTIFYPYIGEIPVDGMTVYEVRDVITERLTEYVTQPQVDVKVIDYRSQRAYVTGQVANPGAIPITNVPLTVLDAISRAGGLGGNANWHEVQLSRNGTESTLSVYEMLNDGRLGQNMLLRDGDVLNVPPIGNQRVFMMGEINNNTLAMGNLRMSLTEAITQAGGLNPANAQASGIFVIRQTAPDSTKLATVYQLDARNALAYVIASRFMLQPADIVYVTTAPIARWNRVINQLVPTMTFFRRVDQVNLIQGN